MKILFCDNIAGISGNMFAASFLNAGIADEEEILRIPALLGYDNLEIKIDKRTKAFILSHHLEVISKSKPKFEQASNKFTLNNAEEHAHNAYSSVIKRIEDSDLNANIKKNAKEIYRELAEAEAQVHGLTLDEVIFHEVGEPDSIIDVVMAGYCLDKTEYDKVYSTPVKLGRGNIKMAHGNYPIPPPASVRLSTGMEIEPVPETIQENNIELSTPTGLAILKYLKPEFISELPKGKILKHGYGAGTKDLKEYPNVFRIVLMDAAAISAGLPYLADEVVEIACNLDDQTAEKTAWCMERLLEAGALDVWTYPVYSKKNRLAVCLTVLVSPGDKDKTADWLLKNTTTFGVRYRTWDRLKLDRKFEKRQTEDGREVTFKVGMNTDGAELKSKPEYEEVKRGWGKWERE